VKLPEKIARFGVDCARKRIGRLSPTAGLIEMGRDVLPAGSIGVRSEQQRVVVDRGNAGVRDPQLDCTLVPEREIAFSGVGIERNERPERGEKDARRVRFGPRPVRHPSK
jgi:hypothetical protein